MFQAHDQGEHKDCNELNTEVLQLICKQWLLEKMLIKKLWYLLLQIGYTNKADSYSLVKQMGKHSKTKNPPKNCNQYLFEGMKYLIIK